MRSLQIAFGTLVALVATAASPQLSAQLVFNEVLFDPSGIDNGRQLVELRNTGDEPIDLGENGYWLYWAPARWQFPPGVVVAPGDIIVVHINRPGEDTEREFHTGVSGTRNLSAVDSIGLFRTNLFGDPSQIVDFVQWGAGGNSGEEVATTAGIWTELAFVDVSSLRDGGSLVYDGSGDAPSDWCVDGSPSLGAENDECTPSFASSQVRLSEVGWTRPNDAPSHYAVELFHEGDLLEDLSGRWLALDGEVAYAFPPGTVVAPEERVIVRFGLDGIDSFDLDAGLFDLYAGAELDWTPESTGSASLHAGEEASEPTQLLDFVQWGGRTALEDAAVAAGHWGDGEFVDASSWRPDGAFAVVAGGVGASRWRVDNTGSIGQPNDAHPHVAIVINEVLLRSSTGAGHAIELLNVHHETVDVGGYTLCVDSPRAFGRRCFTIPGTVSVPSGELVVVEWNRNGDDEERRFFAGTGADYESGAGSFGLFVAADEGDDNNAIDFVAWGVEFETSREAQAVRTGLWTSGDRVDVSVLPESASLAYDGIGDLSSSFRIDDSPSIGELNREPPPRNPFRRGDCNTDGSTDISDAIRLFGLLFSDGLDPVCQAACDSNRDHGVDISDAVYILNWLFRGDDGPPPPNEQCGSDRDAAALTCAEYLAC